MDVQDNPNVPTETGVDGAMVPSLSAPSAIFAAFRSYSDFSGILEYLCLHLHRNDLPIVLADRIYTSETPVGEVSLLCMSHSSSMGNSNHYASADMFHSSSTSSVSVLSLPLPSPKPILRSKEMVSAPSAAFLCSAEEKEILQLRQQMKFCTSAEDSNSDIDDALKKEYGGGNRAAKHGKNVKSNDKQTFEKDKEHAQSRFDVLVERYFELIDGARAGKRIPTKQQNKSPFSIADCAKELKQLQLQYGFAFPSNRKSVLPVKAPRTSIPVPSNPTPSSSDSSSSSSDSDEEESVPKANAEVGSDVSPLSALFLASSSSTLPAAGLEIASKGTTDIRYTVEDFFYSEKSWVGRSPRELLNQYATSNEYKCSFEEIQSSVGFKCKVTLASSRKNKINLFNDENDACSADAPSKSSKHLQKADQLVMPLPCSFQPSTNDPAAKTKRQAEDFVSVICLRRLYGKNSQIYFKMPLPFRELWKNMTTKTKENEEKRLINEAENNNLAIAVKLRAFYGRVHELERVLTSVQCMTTVTRQSLSEEENKANVLNIEISTREYAEAIEKLRTHARISQLYEERVNANKGYHSFLAARQELPVWDYKKEIQRTIRDNDVTVVCGATGSGKTTQIPHFVLEDAFLPKDGASGTYVNILCTQPRRISTLSVAARVSDEVGDTAEALNICGYSIKLDTNVTWATRLTYCTTGILLRRLQSDRYLDGITHIIVDEVHERTSQTDFLLLLLKRVEKERQLRREKRIMMETRVPNVPVDEQTALKATLEKLPLKIILMSATVDANLFVNYYATPSTCGGEARRLPPVIRIPGKMFPVDVFHMEDILESMQYCHRVLGISTIDSVEPFDWDEYLISAFGYNVYNNKFKYKLDDDEGGGTTANDLKEFLCCQGSVNYDVIETLLMHLHIQRCGIPRQPLITTSGYRIAPTLPDPSVPPLPAEGGAILVFLPSLETIKELYSRLSAAYPFNDEKQYRIFILHSSINTANQMGAFAPFPLKHHDRSQSGLPVRKIVLATNIAETGITIPDVVHVIDSGLMKEMSFDQRRGSHVLQEKFITQANAVQRQGRAGRVQNGFCYRLYGRNRYNSMMRFSEPEIMRIPLSEICLHILDLDLGDPFEVLQGAVSVPPHKNIRNAMETLLHVGAVTKVSDGGDDVKSDGIAGEDEAERLRLHDSGGRGGKDSEGDEERKEMNSEIDDHWDVDDSKSKIVIDSPVGSPHYTSTAPEAAGNFETFALTALGRHLSKLPVDVQVGRMILLGALLRCLEPVLVIAAALSHQSPFLSSVKKNDQKKRGGSKRGKGVDGLKYFAEDSGSDHLALYNMYRNWRNAIAQGDERAGRSFCIKHNIHMVTLDGIHLMKNQLYNLLVDIKFVPAAGQGEKRSLSFPFDTPAALNTHSNKSKVIKAVICAGLYPNVATLVPQVSKFSRGNGSGKEWKLEEGRHKKVVHFHPSSANFGYRPNEVSNDGTRSSEYLWLVYHKCLATKKVYLNDSTLIAATPLVLFCGTLQIHHWKGQITLDKWMKFKSKSRTSVLFKALRRLVETMFYWKLSTQKGESNGHHQGGQPSEKLWSQVTETVVTVLQNSS